MENVNINTDSKIYADIVLGIKEDDRTTKKILSETSITTMPIELINKGDRVTLILDMSDYGEDELLYRGCNDLIDNWYFLERVLEVVLYLDESVNFLDFPMEVENQTETLFLKSLIGGKLNQNILTLDFLNCDIGIK